MGLRFSSWANLSGYQAFILLGSGAYSAAMSERYPLQFETDNLWPAVDKLWRCRAAAIRYIPSLAEFSSQYQMQKFFVVEATLMEQKVSFVTSSYFRQYDVV